MKPETIGAYMRGSGMLPEDGEVGVLCACSGGADSTALLHVLRAVPGVRLCCAHYNHGLRGPESDRDEAFVLSLCRDWGIPFYSERGDVAAHAAGRGVGTEAAARELRYDFLARAAAAAGCERIATAHTADDNAETVLLRLLRGAGGRGLGGIPPVRPLGAHTVIRPLLRTTRTELLAYLSERGIAHVEDSSNAGDDYARNRLRHAVMPVLRELNSAAAENICAAAALLREDEAYFQAQVSAFLAAHLREDGLEIPALLALPEVLALRALGRLAPEAGRTHLYAVYALCRGKNTRGALDLPGCRALRRGPWLRFAAPGTAGETAPPGLPRREVRVGEPLALPEIGKTLQSEELIYTKEIYSSFNTFYFQSEKICGKISVASRQPGDRIRLNGRNCTKEVRRLYAEAGLSPARRAVTPVFSDEAGVIAVAGFGVAERCAPAEGEAAVCLTLLD